MAPNAIGKIVMDEWLRTADLRSNVGLDAFVVMPNHLHGIIVIFDEDDKMSQSKAMAYKFEGKPGRLTAGSLGAIIGRFKASVTRRVRELPKHCDLLVWQRNYHDHIIRNERSLNAIREYITFNPSRWAEDDYFVYT